MKSRKPGRKPLKCETGGTRLLVDGDVLVYRIGYTTESEEEWVALARINSYIDEMLFNSGCSDYTVYLTDSKGNFRNALYPEYKANRTQPKPRHYQALREYLVNHEAAEITWGQEADDALGINQNENTIIASIDKDLLMVEGRHFNFVKNEHTVITPEEGTRRFYTQLLTGDATDNIKGLPKVGPVKAKAYLKDCVDEEQYKEATVAAYKERLPELDDEAIFQRINLTGKLLWIRREEDQLWEFNR